MPAPTRAAVWAALGTVVDPELDEPITDLGFVSDCVVEPGAARVRLRLPTAFCAPNFAYLMVSDAHDAVRAVAGIERVTITLDDHSDSAAINAGMAAHLGFADAFPAETRSELDELRRIFQRKAHQAYVERVCSAVLAEGWSQEGLTRLTIGDVPSGPLRDGLLRRRADLGLPTGAGEPVCVDEAGVPWREEELSRRLRFARTVRVSLDGNAHFCRGLLATRYPGAEAVQAERHHELLTLAEVTRGITPSDPRTASVRSTR